MTARRYLVTGGLGFLGRDLVRSLVRDGHTLRILDDESRGSARLLSPELGDVECWYGDVRDAERVRSAVRGCDVVCHLAAINGTRNFYERPVEVLEVGVRGTLNVIDACLREGVRELLYVSSSEVYQLPPTIPTPENVPLTIPDPFNPRYSYAGSKAIGELLVIHHGRAAFERALIVRPHNVYGSQMGWDHVIPALARRLVERMRAGATEPIELPIQGSGEETRAFVYVEDFTRGLRLVLEHGEHLGIYHVGTDEEVTIAELARRIAEFYGVRIRLAPEPGVAGGTPRRCPDIGKLRGLGYEPGWPLVKGLAETLGSLAASLEAGAARDTTAEERHDSQA